jgi:hypothetical protein
MPDFTGTNTECNFAKGNIDGKEKAASLGVVERGCEEFARICQN